MFFTTLPSLRDFAEVDTVESAKLVIEKIASIAKEKKLKRLDVKITLSNGVNSTFTYHRDVESLPCFKKRLLKEAKKHL